MRKAARWIIAASTFSLGLAVIIIGAYYLGSFIDDRLGTGSIFSTLLVVAAIVGGFYRIYLYAQRDSKR